MIVTIINDDGTVTVINTDTLDRFINSSLVTHNEDGTREESTDDDQE